MVVTGAGQNIGSDLKGYLYRKWRNSSAPLRRASVLSAAKYLVTPFSGFILSNYFLSPEVAEGGFHYLNSTSQNLLSGARPLVDGTVVYVQSDSIERFTQEILPTIDKDFYLITGKWHLPSLTLTKAADTLIGSPKVLAWYSQNQVNPDVPIFPFPFGIELTTAPLVRRLMSGNLHRKHTDVLVPHVRIHPHFTSEVREIRSSLTPLMEPEMPIRQYLRLIRRSRFVVSPPGDRPDTYRHWESIALGAVPVGNIGGPLRDLFGGSMMSVEDFADFSRNPFPKYAAPDVSLVLLDTWRRRLIQPPPLPPRSH